jgi:hypothetical protein
MKNFAATILFMLYLAALLLVTTFLNLLTGRP